jgi:hypothetical protein
LEVQVEIRANKKLFDEKYSNTKRNRIMKQLEIAIEYNDFENFEKVYQEGFDDADKQYLKMREARKHLLDFDFLDESGCINTTSELYDCDEAVKWDLDEPTMTPLTRDKFGWAKSRTDRDVDA